MDEVNEEGCWATLVLIFLYLWWFILNLSQEMNDVYNPSSIGNMLIIALFTSGLMLLLYGIFIAAVEYPRSVEIERGRKPTSPSFTEVQEREFKNLYPLVPGVLAGVGPLIVAAIVMSDMYLVRPDLMVLFTAINLSVLFSEAEHFLESSSPFLDSLVAGGMIALLSLFFFRGLELVFSEGLPIDLNFLIMVIIVGIICFTLTPVLTGNAFIDALTFSVISLILAHVLVLGASTAREFVGSVELGRNLVVTMLALTFLFRLTIYGVQGE